MAATPREANPDRPSTSDARPSASAAAAAPARSHRRPVIATGTVATASFFVLSAIVPRGCTNDLDIAVVRGLRSLEDAALPRGGHWFADIARDITSLGSAPVLALVVLLVAGYLAADGRVRDAAAVVVTAIGGLLLDVLLKFSFARERPSVVPHLARIDSSSFPSGHSMLAAVIYLTLGALLARFARRPRLEVIPIAAAAGITLMVGGSRVILGVHYPTDVLAGWAAGAAWASASWLVVDQLARRGQVEGKATT